MTTAGREEGQRGAAGARESRRHQGDRIASEAVGPGAETEGEKDASREQAEAGPHPHGASGRPEGALKDAPMAHPHPRGQLRYPKPLRLLCQAVPPILGSSRCRPSLSLCKGPPPLLISGAPFPLAPSALQCRVLLLPPASQGPRLIHLQKGPGPPPQGRLGAVSTAPQAPLLKSPMPSQCRVLGCPRPQSCSPMGAPPPCTPSPSRSPQTRSHPLKGRPPLSRASPSPCRTVSSSICLKVQPLKGKPIPFSPSPSKGRASSSLRPRYHPVKKAPHTSSPRPSGSLQPSSPPLKACSASSHCGKTQAPPLLGAPSTIDPSLSCRGLLHSLRLSPSRHRGLAFPVNMVLASPELLFSPRAQDFRERELGFTILPRLSSPEIPPNSPTSGFSPTPTPCSLYPGLGSPESQDGHSSRVIQSVPLSAVSTDLAEPQAFSGGHDGQGRDLDTVILQPQQEGQHLLGPAVQVWPWPRGGSHQLGSTSGFGCLFWPCSSGASHVSSAGALPVQKHLQLCSPAPRPQHLQSP